MKQRFITYLPLAALIVLAAWPLLRAGPPGDIDGPNHFYRFVELDWHVRHGDLYPRWLADVHDGFGGPILNFYAPLSYYALVLLRVVIGSFSNTYLAGFGLASALGIVGMYAWAKRQFGSHLAALVAAAAYQLTPHFYVTAQVRGSFPEVCALAIVPWLFWAVLGLIQQPTGRRRAAVSLLYAGLILIHSLSALLFTPVLLIYCLVTAWQMPGLAGRERWGRLAVTGLGLATSGLLAAFFLIPFFTESAYVQLQRASVFDYHAHFIALSELFSPPVPYDPNYIVHTIPDSLPWPQLGLALLGLVLLGITWRKAERLLAASLLVNAGLVVGLAYLAQPGSHVLWEAFPFAYLIQLPGRFLSPAALLLGWLAGAAIVLLPGEWWRGLVAGVVLASIFFFSLTWTFQDFYHYPDAATPLDVVQFEISHPDSLGTTGSQEFVPKWVGKMPDPNTLLDQYSQNLLPFRLAPLPDSVTVSERAATVTSTAFTYDAPEAVTASFYLFYFPGWEARVDGTPVEVRPAPESGWLQVDLPAGQHAVTVSLEATPPQRLSPLVSLLGLLLLFVPWGRTAAVTATAQSRAPSGLSPLWAVLLLGLWVGRVAVIDRMETPFSASEFDTIPNAVSVNFGDQLKLLGVRYAVGPSLVSGGTLDLTLYWQAVQQMTARYSTSVQLVDAYGNRFGQTDHYSPAEVPTPWWPVGKYARDQHLLTSLAGTPPGDYHLYVSVYTGDNGPTMPVNVINADGSTQADYDLGTVSVTQAAPQPAGSLRLLSDNLALKQVSVGDSLPLTLTWNSGEAALPPLTARLQFTDGAGRKLFTANLPPAGPAYPTNQWPPNALILFPQSVLIPPDLPAGVAHVTLALVKEDGSLASDLYNLGDITISVPDRSFAVPPMAQAVNYDFNSAIRLLGYDTGEGSVTFYWQALQPVPVPLTVFVHHFTANGTFDAGNDSPPARAVTSWLPGEVISDTHPIAVGDNFEVGLYNSATGEHFGESYRVKP